MKTKEGFDFSRGKRGPVLPQTGNKEQITIRIDADILDWFRQAVNEAGGGHYPSLINNALREYVTKQRESLAAAKPGHYPEELRVAG